MTVSCASTADKLLFPLKLIRVALLIVFFLLGAFSIVATQFIGIVINFLLTFLFSFLSNFLKLFNENQLDFLKNLKEIWLSFTKKLFIILLVSIMDAISPTNIKITYKYDSSLLPKDTFFTTNDTNDLISNINPFSIFIANHQIYTDWVYLWFILYSGNLSNFIYIMLKDSLSKLLIFGWGMKNYNFIFLSRKWKTDKHTLLNSFNLLNFKSDKKNGNFPYSLVLFPEGTNYSDNRKVVSNNYCQKNNHPNMNNVLYPRITGLRFTLRNLYKTSNYLYDFTIAYSDIKKNQFPEKIYTLSNTYIHGNGPKQVNLFLKIHEINRIPGLNLNTPFESPEDELKHSKIFEEWLVKIWDEKDQLLENFYENSSYILNEKISDLNNTDQLKELNFAEKNNYKVSLLSQ
ncbi:acyltransferase-domain-containing protein [Ascoidea rubescens DSM 1968]|uniref:Acyltransferase-domain-containing protein n=1 Tax=Ascoidea rubescens DSM 1968 TaxID=1344418 RepID=A0A1D2VN29_9ASCO|nr:acyltransferase-domain-containing protein [Ascoidea rubescens DSM 1968]ODV62955.1 acyltransferase-domain-containing protein [Ascoidea rubescens DSM 1968]